MTRSIAALALAAVCLILTEPAPTLAQGSITALGKVVDGEGNPIPDVQVLLEYKGHVVQRYRTKTDKKGVFTHVNVYSGPYRITLKKEGLGETSFDTQLQELDRLQSPPEYRFAPRPAAPPPPPGSGLAAASATAAPADLGQVTAAINGAIALSRSGNTDGAIAAYEAILAATPQIPLVHHNLGMLYKQKGDTGKAMASLAKSVELDPMFVDGYVGLATVLAETGKRAEATEVVKKGTAADPKSGRLQYALGVLAEGSGEIALAKDAFLKAEQLDPQNFETQYHLATVALNQNDTSEAVARLEKFIARAPAGTPTLENAKALLAALKK
jgi:tetratricopeptide (TPR) repeat protein